MNTQIKLDGQEMAMEQAAALVAFCERNEGPMRPVLIHGPSGTGKTRLSSALAQALEEIGFAVYRFDDSGEIRLANDFLGTIAPILESPGRKVIFLDECQKVMGSGFRENGVSPIVHNAFRSIVYPNGDTMKNSVIVPLGAGKGKGEGSLSTVADFTETLFVFMTNETDKLENPASLRKGEFPFRRRLYQIELLPYKREKMAEIIPTALAEAGLRAADCSQRLILDFHRCTMEPIQSLINAFRFKFPETNVLSKEKVLAAARLTPFFPRGLIRREVQLLRELRDNSGKLKTSLVAARLGCEPRNVRSAIAHLIGQQSDTKTGGRVHTPFVVTNGSETGLTEVGAKYLAQIEKDEFNF